MTTKERCELLQRIERGIRNLEDDSVPPRERLAEGLDEMPLIPDYKTIDLDQVKPPALKAVWHELLAFARLGPFDRPWSERWIQESTITEADARDRLHELVALHRVALERFRAWRVWC